MLPLVIFIIALIVAAIFMQMYSRWEDWVDIVLGSLLFFNVGIFGFMACYAHTIIPNQTAALIGWAPGSPFQFEVGMANLAFGVLGVMSLWFQRKFWLATIVGYSVFLFGAFFGHLIEYSKGNDAPYNIGLFVWFQDLILPIVLLSLLYLHFKKQYRY
ncbi:MAG: DUF6790 family protein [Waddliaceae bacterium]